MDLNMGFDQNQNKNKWSHLFTDKICLAPMVRENSLAFRLLCLKYGADIVYSEELIDYRLSECRRLVNRPLGTIDFVDNRGEILFRTCDAEKGKIVLQLGSNNPERALKAAKLVSQDVLAIDFNFGCPKSFSLSGGMGAALLDKPDQIKAILTNSVENLNIPVTCKMRILPSLEKTLELVKLIESCGVSCIAVHGRTKDQRPQHENQNNFLRAIAHNISVPMIANGGSNHIKSHCDILEFKKETNASSVMIARAAMKYPPIFDKNNRIESQESIIVDFLKLAVRYNNYLANTKYTIQTLIGEGHFGWAFTQEFHAACDFASLCRLFKLGDWYEVNRIKVNEDGFYEGGLGETELDTLIDEKKKLLDLEQIQLVCDNIPYMPKVFGRDSPKSKISSLVNKLHHLNKNRPEFNVFQLGQHRYYCLILFKNKCYVNKTFSNSKKGAEQASAILLCNEMKLIDLEDYRKRTTGIVRNIA